MYGTRYVWIRSFTYSLLFIFFRKEINKQHDNQQTHHHCENGSVPDVPNSAPKKGYPAKMKISRDKTKTGQNLAHLAHGGFVLKEKGETHCCSRLFPSKNGIVSLVSLEDRE